MTARWAWRQITSMRTALILLFLLALASVPGSILPQEGADPASVQQYFAQHPALAPWLNRLGLFNVFASPWFAAIYLLLFVSLVGCVVPRTFRLAGSTRTPPPKAPRFLSRLPHSASFTSSLPPAEAADAAAAVLGGHGFRLRRPGASDSGSWVSAEKGYLREAGNLLFHLALLGVLISIGLGGIFGYKADKLLVEGQGFADTVSALDEFHPGRLATGSDLAPFDITLKKFSASYLTSGQDRGQPSKFNASLSYTASPGAARQSYDLQVNHPLSVDGVKVYLIGHGYAPVFRVTDARGKTVYDQATPFIPASTSSMLSDGVVKAPSAAPVQLGFMGVFVPTAEAPGGTLSSAFPAPRNPAVSLIGYTGNLGLDSGQPQSVYQLDTTAMSKVPGSPHLLFPGQTWKLPHGQGSVTFTGYKQWVSLSMNYDPGQVPALVCGMLALAGLLLSFLIRRRRMFVRAVAADSGPGSIVTVGGLARTDASGGFAEEFAELAAELAGPDPPGDPPEASLAAGAGPRPGGQTETGA
ncbi:MAG: cytochrome c biogenesis protein ResB [Nocardiopsaceae bacterium]|nr:cytochrome c biogenesis protein ResB [Nocardiopsaceae bacterium]